MEELIGKKILGFKFKSGTGSVSYNYIMDTYIDKPATILYKDNDGYGYVVRFDDESIAGKWNYPYPELLDHLVEEERSIEEIIIKMKELILQI
jgi:hypothetical protein